LKSFNLKNNIKWQFILERAPWWGGFYERLIGIVKNSLKKVLGKSLINFEEMNTVLAEIEGVTNSRPLTYISEEEYSENLTPNHLIYGRNITASQCNISDIEESSKQSYREMRKHCSDLIKHFKQRFIEEYLNALKQRHIHQRSRKNLIASVLAVGDVVLIKQPKPRLQWKKGKIEELIKGRDGEIRGVKLTTVNSKFEKIYLNLPVQLIVPLELTAINTNAAVDDEVRTTRRVAAKNADLIRRLNDM